MALGLDLAFNLIGETKLPTHNHPAFKNKAFISTAEGQKAMAYGDIYFEPVKKNKDLLQGETGTSPIQDKHGNFAGALEAYPTGRIIVIDKDKWEACER